jgi:CheY-like chemotaxis protein
MMQKNGFEPSALTTPETEYIWRTREEQEGNVLPAASLPPRLLLIEADTGLRALLELVLKEEGYALQVVSSVGHALALASVQAFDFVLADLSFASPRHLFRTIRPLKERMPSVQLGAVVRGTISPEEVEKQGFAFVVSRPIAVEQLLVQLAICLQRALTPAQAQQAQVVGYFFEALTLKDRARLLSVCAEDFLYFPSAHGPPPLATLLRGRAALANYVETLRRTYNGVRVELEHTYSRPKGLAAQYSIYWAEPGSPWEMMGGTFLMQFTGARIRQIGLRTETN